MPFKVIQGHETEKLQSLRHVFVAGSMGLSSFTFSWWAPKDACVLKRSASMTLDDLEGRYHNGLQGHPRSLIWAPIERAYATSY